MITVTYHRGDASVGLPECFTVDHPDMQEPMILAVDELQELQAAIAKALLQWTFASTKEGDA